MGANSSQEDSSEKRRGETNLEYCMRNRTICDENPPVEYCEYLSQFNKKPPKCNKKLSELERNRKGPHPVERTGTMKVLTGRALEKAQMDQKQRERSRTSGREVTPNMLSDEKRRQLEENSTKSKHRSEALVEQYYTNNLELPRHYIYNYSI